MAICTQSHAFDLCTFALQSVQGRRLHTETAGNKAKMRLGLAHGLAAGDKLPAFEVQEQAAPVLSIAAHQQNSPCWTNLQHVGCLTQSMTAHAQLLTLPVLT